jgi:beta-lactamase regulating signal transducer with metallopeptidase domain
MISVLVEAALRALLVALAVWAGLGVLRMGNVLAQKAAWGLVLAAAVAMPWAMRWQGLPAGLGVVVPAYPWQAMQQKSVDARPAARAAASSSSSEGAPGREDLSATSQNLPEALNRFPAPSISGSGAGAAMHSTPASTPVAHRSFPRPATLGWLLYLAVCAGLLLRLIYGLAAAARLWRTAEPIAPDSLPGPSSRLAEGLSLRTSRLVASPVTLGSGVLLPAEYLEWDTVKLRIVLAHERSHVRQGDFYLQMLAGLYAIVFWFSPLGWWLKRKLSDLGETISDRAGLREAANSSSYAQILLEFAAMPRPTLQGVAMARRSNLSERIERLLNDSIFHQAFVGSRRRALVAVLLVPAALFAATALIRVEAASQAQQPASATGQSHPDQAEPAAEPADSAATPEPTANSGNAPADAAQITTDTQVNVNPQVQVHVIPDFHVVPDVHVDPQVITDTQTNTNVTVNGRAVRNRGFSYNVSSNGDSYALVTGPGDRLNISGNGNGSADEQIEKARKLAHGNFLWFTRNGKSYFVDDPATLAGIEAMYRPMEVLGRQQEALGRQQAELGRQQRELGRQMERLRVPTPEASKEIEELKAEMATLKAQMKKNASPEELAEMGGKMGELGGRMGALEGKMGAQQGELGGKMGALGEQQGKLGEQQGKLGAEQGRMGQEADRKVRSIMDQTLRDGKARPIQ